ncbi:F-type H+-transporting ATPase subunit delta [Allopseudospirillum japonicum]|uniref:ATP synthase subunit delta n=1 Tax=Allopseudospirillum japonicum TaxID=64971 RepID=A0A1H6RCY3_9GAMM|nr:F0F1 ATP synthase subunit delta [Allopseudospirillum japonicum]SEI52346.1 F-type H+-transporting ATPase subunit delta [Allopseudospirillum japonicum]
MAETTTVARPYAKAAFEFALSQGKLNDWSKMLSAVAAAADQGEVKQLLLNPALTSAQKAEVLLEICQSSLDESVRHFVLALSENGRLPLIPVIAELYEALRAEQEQTVDVVVTSAYPLDEQQQNKLAQALRKRLNREVNLSTHEDKSLIGGIIIRAGDLVIDGSVRGKLAKLAEALKS